MSQKNINYSYLSGADSRNILDLIFRVICSNMKWDRPYPFWANVQFLYPLKTSGNQRFSDVFKGYRNGTLALNRLNRKKTLKIAWLIYNSKLWGYTWLQLRIHGNFSTGKEFQKSIPFPEKLNLKLYFKVVF